MPPYLSHQIYELRAVYARSMDARSPPTVDAFGTHFTVKRGLPVRLGQLVTTRGFSRAITTLSRINSTPFHSELKPRVSKNIGLTRIMNQQKGLISCLHQGLVVGPMRY